MNWNNFSLGILALFNQNITQRNQIDAIYNLFQIACAENMSGSKKPEFETIKKWLQKEKKNLSPKLNMNIYFPNKRIEETNNEKLFKYLRGRENGKSFVACQKRFAEIRKTIEDENYSSENKLIKDNNDNFCIDIQTEDEGVFRISLINQFTTLLNIINLSDEIKIRLLDGFKKAIQSREEANVVCEVPDSSNGTTDIVSQLSFRNTERNQVDIAQETVDTQREASNVSEKTIRSFSTLAIPQECNSCLFCKSWQGSLDEVEQELGNIALIKESQIERRCLIFGKETTASKNACDKFQANFKSVSSYLFHLQLKKK